MTKFIFDLDGTITKKETLPLIAEYFDIKDKIEKLTKETISGTIAFAESFIKSVYVLGDLPINEVADLLANVPLYKGVVKFIKENKENCVIATGNLECWVEKLLKRIDCQYYCSAAQIADNKVSRMTAILKKENVVKLYQNQGEQVVFIGDGDNDVEAMRLADISIASGLTHHPAPSVLSIADYLTLNEEGLCRQLNQLL